MNCVTPSALAALWFPSHQRAVATSVVYAIQMAGPSVGFLLGLGIKNSHLGAIEWNKLEILVSLRDDSGSHEGMMNDFVTHFCHIFVGREYDFVGLGGWFMSRGRIRWCVEQDWTMLQSLVRAVSSKRYIGANITNIVTDIPPIPFLGQFDHFPGSFFDDTVDGRNPAPPGMFKKPCK